MTAVFIAFAVALLVAVGSVAVLVLRRRSGLRRRLRRTLVVTTKDGHSFRGVLAAEHADCLVLEQAELLDEQLTIGGQAVLLLANISWAQDVTGVPRPDATAEASGRFEIERSAVR